MKKKKKKKKKRRRIVCFIKHHAMKTYGGVEEEFHAFLTLELDGG
jgi:hypothetical protein